MTYIVIFDHVLSLYSYIAVIIPNSKAGKFSLIVLIAGSLPWRRETILGPGGRSLSALASVSWAPNADKCERGALGVRFPLGAESPMEDGVVVESKAQAFQLLAWVARKQPLAQQITAAHLLFAALLQVLSFFPFSACGVTDCTRGRRLSPRTESGIFLL